MAIYKDIPDGFVEYMYMKQYKYRIERVFVDLRLKGNDYVDIICALDMYEKFYSDKSALSLLVEKYKSVYLDIEKKKLLPEIETYIGKCFDDLDRMNKDLSPFHWEEVQYDNRKCLCLVDTVDRPLLDEIANYRIFYLEQQV